MSYAHRPLRSSAAVRRGLSAPEALVSIACAGVTASLLLPLAASARADSMTTASLENLRVLGTAHVIYAGASGGRQFTPVPDTLAAFGSDASSAFANYQSDYSLTGHTLGWGPIDGDGQIVLFRYRPQFNLANARLLEPIVFDGPNLEVNGFFGAFRMPNVREFNTYVGGRFYDPTFYAPTDSIVAPLVEPLSEEIWEYVDRPPVAGFGDAPYWSSYTLSAAAMFDPAVMQRRTDTGKGVVGGWQDPYSMDFGFRSPGLFQAQYPNLKTLMVEHHWLQNAPADPCNPAVRGGTYGGCEPYYFNHAIDSSPASLFYDGSTRLLSNVEAVASDEAIRSQTGNLDGTWLRDTPFGEDGYFSEIAFDDTRVSHHVLTADGILGRDTLGPNAADRGGKALAPRFGERAADALSATGPAGPSAKGPRVPAPGASFSP